MKKAFTIIELIFIVILIGIMAGVSTAYFKEDKLSLGTINTLEAIRYTQHLAISDHKFDPKDSNYNTKTGHINANNGAYFRENWQIMFTKTNDEFGLTVWSDRNRDGAIDAGETAKQPLDMENYTINMTQKYEIKGITFGGGCANTGTEGFSANANNRIGSISFDNKGRPYTGISDNAPYKNRLNADCTITLTHDDGTAVIKIYPETGFAEY